MKKISKKLPYNISFPSRHIGKKEYWKAVKIIREEYPDMSMGCIRGLIFIRGLWYTAKYDVYRVEVSKK